jgi:hypothetical protein
VLHDRIDGTAAAIKRQTAVDALRRRSVTSEILQPIGQTRGVELAGRQRPGAEAKRVNDAAPASLSNRCGTMTCGTPASAAAAVVPAPP